MFVDFWNFTLELKSQDPAFRADWTKIGPLFGSESAKLIDPSVLSTFEGMHVYGSFDPTKPQDANLRNWFANKLDKMPGVHVAPFSSAEKAQPSKVSAMSSRGAGLRQLAQTLRGTEEEKGGRYADGG